MKMVQQIHQHNQNNQLNLVQINLQENIMF